MSNCPYCLEEINPGARKCPHCHTTLDSGTIPDDVAVYVADKGLVKYGKFVVSVLAIFVVVGAYLFGISIDTALKEIDTARKEISQANNEVNRSLIEVQKALVDIEQRKLALEMRLIETEALVSQVNEFKEEIVGHRDDTIERTREIEILIAEIRLYREEADQLLTSMRPLNDEEETVAASMREELGIESERGKLWAVGTQLSYYFLDGEEREKEIVRRAIERWAEHVNLAFQETSSPSAEIRISFEQPGSWSYVGTDALGVPADQPTLNYGFLTDVDDQMAMETALHEFGHTLGLVHEFQNPSGGEIFDREAVTEYFSGPPNHWSEEAIMANVLAKNEQYPGERPYDPESIMNYTFPESMFVPGMATRSTGDLSDSDIVYVAALYPQF